ncbi:hypothetical protein, partial [Rhizobium dioscoreae]|uniref:hypothetical protein n=1 Tax=Rhizobium dioscoreae TaxID=2653122 RepID=UPI001AED3854
IPIQLAFSVFTTPFHVVIHQAFEANDHTIASHCHDSRGPPARRMKRSRQRLHLLVHAARQRHHPQPKHQRRIVDAPLNFEDTGLARRELFFTGGAN